MKLRRHRVSRVAVQVMPRTVVRPGRTRVAVPHRVLDVLQRDAVGEQLGSEAVAQAVRADPRGSGDAGALGEPADERVARGVRQAFGAVGVEEIGPLVRSPT